MESDNFSKIVWEVEKTYNDRNIKKINYILPILLSLTPYTSPPSSKSITIGCMFDVSRMYIIIQYIREQYSAIQYILHFV